MQVKKHRVRMRKTIQALSGVLLSFILAASTVAQHEHHQPLALSPTLSFHDILANALEQAPEAAMAPLREELAQNYTNAGKSWLAGRPALTAGYLDDTALDNQGLTEIEYGVQLPLWRLGEKADTARLGKSYQQQSQFWQQAQRVNLTGKVRILLADLAAADQLLANERLISADATQMHAVSQRLFSLGVISKLELMESEHALLEQQKREIQANAAVQDAEVVYRLVTGLLVRPEHPIQEVQSAQTELTVEHPLLQFLQSEVTVAAAQARQTEIAAKGSPQLTVGSRRQRSDRLQPYLDSVGISLNIPFGGNAYVSARTSAARLQQADAQVEYQNTLRTLQLALHEAEHQLDLTREALPVVEQQARLSTERHQLAQKAFAAGEITVVQVISALQAARVSTRELAALKLQEQRLIGEYNQVLGVVP
jgi:cobalt-zinc-cadmium efflux system outer membrane protein